MWINETELVELKNTAVKIYRHMHSIASLEYFFVVILMNQNYNFHMMHLISRIMNYFLNRYSLCYILRTLSIKKRKNWNRFNNNIISTPRLSTCALYIYQNTQWVHLHATAIQIELGSLEHEKSHPLNYCTKGIKLIIVCILPRDNRCYINATISVIRNVIIQLWYFYFIRIIVVHFWTYIYIHVMCVFLAISLSLFLSWF